MQFLRYAFASNGELKAGYYAAEGRQSITAEELANLAAINESVAKMLRRWQDTLEQRDSGPRTKSSLGSRATPRTAPRTKP